MALNSILKFGTIIMNFPQYRVDNAGQLEEEEGGRGRDVRILPDKLINKQTFLLRLSLAKIQISR